MLGWKGRRTPLRHLTLARPSAREAGASKCDAPERELPQINGSLHHLPGRYLPGSCRHLPGSGSCKALVWRHSTRLNGRKMEEMTEEEEGRDLS